MPDDEVLDETIPAFRVPRSLKRRVEAQQQAAHQTVGYAVPMANVLRALLEEGLRARELKARLAEDEQMLEVEK